MSVVRSLLVFFISVPYRNACLLYHCDKLLPYLYNYKVLSFTTLIRLCILCYTFQGPCKSVCRWKPLLAKKQRKYAHIFFTDVTSVQFYDVFFFVLHCLLSGGTNCFPCFNLFMVVSKLLNLKSQFTECRLANLQIWFSARLYIWTEHLFRR